MKLWNKDAPIIRRIDENDVYKIMMSVILKIMLKAKTVQTFATVTYSEHAEILETIEKRDRTAYQYKMKTHLDAGFRHFSD